MFKISLIPPNKDSFLQLRESIGWDNCSKTVIQKSIENSLFWVSLYEGENLVATGRVIGDGAMYFYIQDIIVIPTHQGQGLGNQIMQHIENYLLQNTTKHATVGLLAAKGIERFYQKYGYLLRDGQNLGHALCKFV